MADKTSVAPVGKAAAAAHSTCPTHPYQLFAAMTVWAAAATKWAYEVDACYTSVHVDGQELQVLCKMFEAFAEQAKLWGDAVDLQCADCMKVHQKRIRDHGAFPTPPFGDGLHNRADVQGS